MKYHCLISLIAALLLLGCSRETVVQVPVDFDATEQAFEDLVASIELLPLHGTPESRMGYAPGLYTADGNWFLLQRDPMPEPDFRRCKLYRYDSEGHFLNAIGRKGERLDEIFDIQGIQFRDGHIVVFSLEPAGGGQKAITYDYEGNVLDARHYPFAGGQSLQLPDGILTYYGHGDRHGREGRLMLYSEEGLPRQAFLTERTAAMNFQPSADVLCPTEDGIVVLDTFSDTLWRYNAGQLKPFIAFDMGPYTIDDEFFATSDMREAAQRLFKGAYAMVNRYLDGGGSRLVELSVQTADRKRSWLYGHNDGSGWHWFRACAPYAGSFQLLAGRQACCLLEPEKDNYVIARITFSK